MFFVLFYGLSYDYYKIFEIATMKIIRILHRYYVFFVKYKREITFSDIAGTITVQRYFIQYLLNMSQFFIWIPISKPGTAEDMFFLFSGVNLYLFLSSNNAVT